MIRNTESENREGSCLFSIIIPIYNCEKYIEQCMESILSQNEQDLEVICIDDGSTDSSLDLLKKYAAEDFRVKVYSQNNAGAGKARNRGIDISRGKFLLFLDGDDYYVPESLSIMKSLTELSSADMIVCDYFEYHDDSGKIVRKELQNLTEGVSFSTEGGEIRYKMTSFNENKSRLINTSVVPWNKIYNRDFIISNKIRFDNIRYANDRSFHFKCMMKSESIIICDAALVHYRRNTLTSLTNSFSLKRFNCHIFAYFSVIRETDSLDQDFQKAFFQASVSDILSFFYKSLKNERWNLFKKIIGFFNRIDSKFIDDLYSNKHALYSKFVLVRSSRHLLDKKEKDVIPIVMASDKNYAPYLSVTLQSIKDNASDDKFYDIYVFHSTGIGMSNINRIRSMSTKNVSVTFVNIDSYIENVPLYTRAHYSKDMFNRILIPDILFHYEKVCYLDCDIVTLADISEFYEQQTNGNILVAVRNSSNSEMDRFVRNVLKLDANKYFNSGVLLIDCEEFYKNNIKEKCFELLTNNKKYVCPDQDALNVTCAGKVQIVSDEWNFQWHTGMRDGYNSRYRGQKIIHYTSGEKPWNRPDFSLSEYFWKYARRTEFYETILYKDVFSRINLNRNFKSEFVTRSEPLPPKNKCKSPTQRIREYTYTFKKKGVEKSFRTLLDKFKKMVRK